MTKTGILTEFLTARWDEQEALYDGLPDNERLSVHRHDGRLFPGKRLNGSERVGDSRADLAAKRKIVEAYRAASEAASSIRQTFAGSDQPQARIERASYDAAASAWRSAVELLALPYVDHPDFNPAWRP